MIRFTGKWHRLRRGAKQASHVTLLAMLCGLAAATVASAQEAQRTQEAEPTSTADLAARLLPAVVSIRVVRLADDDDEAAPPAPRVPRGSPFRDFFDQAPRRSRAVGSGFVISSEGLIVTNNHVIADATDIMVSFNDGSEFIAELVGADPLVDLALLRVEAGRELLSVPWGNSGRVRVGDPVIAIGTPFGLGSSLTTGVISAVQRNIRSGPYSSFLQTDAAINSGNSGGPLFNLQGEVIGINTAILSPSGGSVGIGFSIPSSVAEGVVRELEAFGRTRRGGIGVTLQPVDSQIAAAVGLNAPRGALVAEVFANGAAADAGILVGDIILSFDNRLVGDPDRLQQRIGAVEIGRTVPITIWRDGAPLDLEIEVGEFTGMPAAAEPDDTPEINTVLVDSLGIAVATLTAEARVALGIPTTVDGVLIVGVNPTGGAAREDVRPGDLVDEINQTKVTAPEQLVSAIAAARAKGRTAVLLRINRRGMLRLVGVALRGPA